MKAIRRGDHKRKGDGHSLEGERGMPRWGRGGWKRGVGRLDGIHRGNWGRERKGWGMEKEGKVGEMNGE